MKRKRPGFLPAVFGFDRCSLYRGGAMPGGGGGSEAVAPLSSGGMRREGTRRVMRVGAEGLSFRYFAPSAFVVRRLSEMPNFAVSTSDAGIVRPVANDQITEY